MVKLMEQEQLAKAPHSPESIESQPGAITLKGLSLETRFSHRPEGSTASPSCTASWEGNAQNTSLWDVSDPNCYRDRVS